MTIRFREFDGSVYSSLSPTVDDPGAYPERGEDSTPPVPVALYLISGEERRECSLGRRLYVHGADPASPRLRHK